MDGLRRVYEVCCVVGEYVGHMNKSWGQTFNLMFVKGE